MIFKLGDFKINMEFWTMEIKKMWIKIFQLKRSFISLLNLLFYSHHVMTMRSRRILFMCMIYVYNHRWNGDILFRKEVIERISKVLLFSFTLSSYLLTSTNFSTLHAFLNFISRFLLSDSIDSFRTSAQYFKRDSSNRCNFVTRSGRI